MNGRESLWQDHARSDSEGPNASGMIDRAGDPSLTLRVALLTKLHDLDERMRESSAD